MGSPRLLWHQSWRGWDLRGAGKVSCRDPLGAEWGGRGLEVWGGGCRRLSLVGCSLGPCGLSRAQSVTRGRAAGGLPDFALEA